MNDAKAMQRLGLGFAIVVTTTAATIGGCRGGYLELGYNDPDPIDGGGGSGGGGACAPGSTAPCYSGPAGTEGMGLCRAGAQICNADGTGYGACEGEVLPSAEDCATAMDEDCDGLAPPCTGVALWSKRFGDAYLQSGSSIAVDSAGGIVITGLLYGSADFGGDVLVSVGSADIFVAKFDADGNHLWSKRFGDTSSQEGVSIAVDAAANVLIGGQFGGIIDFGGGPLTSVDGGDYFMVKLSAEGEHIWSKRFVDAGHASAGPRVAFDAIGNALILGDLLGTMDFDGNLLVSAGITDIFVGKLDAAGNHLWSKRFGDASDQRTGDIAMDTAGHLFVTGSFGGTLDFGGDPLVSASASDTFLAKLDEDGNHLWSKRFGAAAAAPTRERVPAATDPAGNVVLSGSFVGAIDFGGGPLSNAGDSEDIFLAKFDPTGNHVFSKRFGDSNAQWATDIAIDGASNVVFTGEFFGTLGFGGGQLASAGSSDGFAAKVDIGGNHLWSRRFGDVTSDVGRGAAVDDRGNVLLIGAFTDTVDFGNGPLVSAGGLDIFIAKFTP